MAEKNSVNQRKVIEVIQRITGEEAKIIAVPSELIQFVGSITPKNKTQKAVFLAQLIYWSDRGKRTDGFIFKNHREWKEETGLSYSQVASYAELFEEKGFVKTKLKKANGNPTTHYRFNLDKFLACFEKFLQNRILNKVRNQSEETDESLTENTTNNSLYNNSNFDNDGYFESEENVIDADYNVNEELSYFNVKIGSNVKDSAGKNLKEKVLIPLDFFPTIDEQYRAIKAFEYKSPADVTRKLIKLYQEKGTKLTIQQWHQKWWDWMHKERNDYGNLKLDSEQVKIRNQVGLDIYNATLGVDFYLFDLDNIVFYVSDNYGDRYSPESIIDITQDLFDIGVFALVDKFIFNYQECQNSTEYREKVQSVISNMRLDKETIKVTSTSPETISLRELWNFDNWEKYW